MVNKKLGSQKMLQKFYIIPEKEVKGNLRDYTQKYGFVFLPKEDGLPEKLVLTVKTDIMNSLRFANEIEFMEFIEDSVYAYITFLEFKRNPQYREGFRNIQLDDVFKKIRHKCVNEWKTHL